MKKFYPPKFKESKFNCIYCDVYAQQNWGQLEYESTTNKSGIWYCMCEHCKEISFWFNENPIIPSDAPVPQPHEDMPTSCIEDYYEARDIVSRSPKAGAAIIRLCIQKLMVELGEKGKNINEDIGNLVKKGLPVEVQQEIGRASCRERV